MNKRIIFPALAVMLTTGLIIASCSKDDGAVDATQLKKDILVNTAQNVCLAGYEDMYSKTQLLLASVNTLTTTTTDPNLKASQDLWKAIRNTWEQSEAWLFGPVSADNIDPRIDTWPVDFNALETILASSNTLDEDYIDGLDDALKGFHPIEYLLWGQNGTKTAAAFTRGKKNTWLL